MTEEYGPSIAVNGKRPEWLGDYDRCIVEYRADSEMVLPRDGKFHAYAQARYWPDVINVRAKADHPYYQSAEYKASVGKEPEGDDVPGQAGCPIRDAVATLEAAGYTVTPPDPLAADREFLAGLMHAMGYLAAFQTFMDRKEDHRIPAAMEYLRANKGRL